VRHDKVDETAREKRAVALDALSRPVDRAGPSGDLGTAQFDVTKRTADRCNARQIGNNPSDLAFRGIVSLCCRSEQNWLTAR
jgi:hypothetical protein